MRIRFTVAFVAMATFTACATGAEGEHIGVAEAADRIEVTVPESKVVLSFPKAGFRRAEANAGGATANPRYFQFHDDATGTVLSGWFEPSSRYQPIDPTLGSESTVLKRVGAWPPRDLQQGTIGEMSTLSYFLPLPGGVTNFHIRASYRGAGTWIDLHGSVTNRDDADAAKARLTKLFESLQFRKR